MRLLNTETFGFEEHVGRGPAYAILSHTWGEEEVTQQDMLSGGKSDKILRSCAQAKEDGFAYIWIDTCCIDKSSSAELSEAINSMYKWYSKAHVCYVYMSDVPGGLSGEEFGAKFKQSRWFTRGWTLQELMAPSMVIFFAEDWSELGTKSSLRALISAATGIEEQYLLGNEETPPCTAVRMYWACKRETSRVEDIAYCLMGLFGVNMPILYGEGENAFKRLQEEIIRISDDESIFAWTSLVDRHWSSLLARRPRDFRNASRIQRYDYPFKQPYAMTNFGLRLMTAFAYEDGRHYATLNCRNTDFPYHSIAVALSPIPQEKDAIGHTIRFTRVATQKLHYREMVNAPGASSTSIKEIYVKEKDTFQISRLPSKWPTRVSFIVGVPVLSTPTREPFEIIAKHPPEVWPLSTSDVIPISDGPSPGISSLTSKPEFGRTGRTEAFGLQFQHGGSGGGEGFMVILGTCGQDVWSDLVVIDDDEPGLASSLEDVCASYDPGGERSWVGYLKQDRVRIMLRSGTFEAHLSLKKMAAYVSLGTNFKVDIRVSEIPKEAEKQGLTATEIEIPG